MDYKKEYFRVGMEFWSGRIFIDSYSRSYDHITMLVDEAKRDHPYLKDEDVMVHVYLEENKGILGVEFSVAADKRVAGYKIVNGMGENFLS